MLKITPSWLLLVEDNEDDEQLTIRAFKSSKRPEVVLVARNGEEALAMLRGRTSPQLVLLDLKLPRLSGVEVLMAIKDDPRLRTIPVVVLTSSAERSDLGACYELGCSAFVQKPVDYSEFMARLSVTLQFWLDINLVIEPTLENEPA